MSELITRRIEPRIEKLNKILFFIIPVLFIIKIMDNHTDLGIIINMMLIIVIVSLSIFELIVYIKNEEIIKILDRDKYSLGYKIIMKYYKLIIMIVLVQLVFYFGFSMKNQYELTDYLYVLMFYIIGYSGFIEYFIFKNGIFKIICKTLIIFWGYGMLISYASSWNFSNTYMYFNIILYQLLYLLINFNIMWLRRNEDKKRKNFNYDLIISLSLIVIYELWIFLSFRNIEGIFSLLLYIVLVYVLFSINHELKKKYKIKKSKYNKLVGIYTTCLLLGTPIMMNLMISNFGNPEMIVMRVFNVRGIIEIIIFELAMILMIVLYKHRRKYFEVKIIKKASDLYDDWF